MTTKNHRRAPFPVIEKIDARIACLQRRQDHLERKLSNIDYATTASAEFDRAEVVALRGAIEALNWIRDNS